MEAIPLIDLSGWIEGDSSSRNRIAAEVDDAMRSSGFLLVIGHGISPDLVSDTRAAAGKFFQLRGDVKRRYATVVGGRGWLPLGVEANGYSSGTPTPPDLKESFVCGPPTPSTVSGQATPVCPTNVWPEEIPELQTTLTAFLAEAEALALLVLEVCARALKLADDTLTRLCQHAPYGCNVNRYPPLTEVGVPRPGQFRVGPHSDFGTVTVLGRQPGIGALQVEMADGTWMDMPYLPGSLAVNTGDLLALWTARRWRSTRHRVLPPSQQVPSEELVSLVFFHTADADALIEPFGPAGSGMKPVVAGDHLRRQLESITIAGRSG